MKLLREFMLGKYRQYVADQKTLRDVDVLRNALTEARQLIGEQAVAQTTHEALVRDIGRFHDTLLSLQRADVSADYRVAVEDVSAIFTVVLGRHTHERT